MNMQTAKPVLEELTQRKIAAFKSGDNSLGELLDKAGIMIAAGLIADAELTIAKGFRDDIRKPVAAGKNSVVA